LRELGFGSLEAISRACVRGANVETLLRWGDRVFTTHSIPDDF
jgi:hypothetical protein